MKGSKKHPPGSDISVPGVDLGQLERLLSFMSEHGLEEFEYARGDLRIRLKKTAAPTSAPPNWAPTGSAPASGGSGTPQPSESPIQEQHFIKSPIVGTYYSGSNPEAAPFVRAGDMVR